MCVCVWGDEVCVVAGTTVWDVAPHTAKYTITTTTIVHAGRGEVEVCVAGGAAEWAAAPHATAAAIPLPRQAGLPQSAL